MAVIENAAASQEALAAWQASLASMTPSELRAQQLVQRGADHALTQLLELGADEHNARAMLTSVREALMLIHEAAYARGVHLIDYAGPNHG